MYGKYIIGDGVDEEQSMDTVALIELTYGSITTCLPTSSYLYHLHNYWASKRVLVGISC